MGSTPRGISASRGAAVLGLSEFQTPLEVFQRIMEEREPGWNNAHGYALPPEPDNAAMRWGTAFEGAVIELAERAQGKKIIHRERFDDAPNMDYITCHLDGIYENTDALIHEGKTTSAFTFREKWGEPETDRIPRSYQVQVQHQMLCAGAREAIVSVLVFPETPDRYEQLGWQTVIATDLGDAWYLQNETNKKIYQPLITMSESTGIGHSPSKWAEILCAMGNFHQYPVQASADVQRLMADKYREFWHNHVLEGIPPEPRNYEDIKRLCPEPKSTIVVPEIIERKIAEYKGITEETANAKKRKDRLKTNITKYAAGHGGVIDDESAEAVIFRSASGGKLGSWYKTKTGALVFRA